MRRNSERHRIDAMIEQERGNDKKGKTNRLDDDNREPHADPCADRARR